MSQDVKQPVVCPNNTFDLLIKFTATDNKQVKMLDWAVLVMDDGDDKFMRKTQAIRRSI